MDGNSLMVCGMEFQTIGAANRKALRFTNVENKLHFNLADFPAVCQITAVMLVVMSGSKNLHVFNFAILLRSR